MYPNNSFNFNQTGNFTNIPPNKVELINQLTNQNYLLQNQIMINNNLMQNLMNEQDSDSILYGYNTGSDINIIFEATSGLTIVIRVRYNIQIENLLYIYMMRIGKESNLYDEDITFLYNERRIDKHDKTEISKPNYMMRDNSKIKVIDPNNKIGRTISI